MGSTIRPMHAGRSNEKATAGRYGDVSNMDKSRHCVPGWLDVSYCYILRWEVNRNSLYDDNFFSLRLANTTQRLATNQSGS